jgi:hypothetical protein
LTELFPHVDVSPAPVKPLREQSASAGYHRQVLAEGGYAILSISA